MHPKDKGAKRDVCFAEGDMEVLQLLAKMSSTAIMQNQLLAERASSLANATASRALAGLAVEGISLTAATAEIVATAFSSLVSAECAVLFRADRIEDVSESGQAVSKVHCTLTLETSI